MIRARAANRSGVSIPFGACAPGLFRHSTPERVVRVLSSAYTRGRAKISDLQKAGMRRIARWVRLKPLLTAGDKSMPLSATTNRWRMPTQREPGQPAQAHRSRSARLLRSSPKRTANQRGEFMRDLIFREMHCRCESRSRDDPALQEIVGVQLLLMNVLKPLATGQPLTAAALRQHRGRGPQAEADRRAQTRSGGK